MFCATGEGERCPLGCESGHAAPEVLTVDAMSVRWDEEYPAQPAFIVGNVDRPGAPPLRAHKEDHPEPEVPLYLCKPQILEDTPDKLDHPNRRSRGTDDDRSCTTCEMPDLFKDCLDGPGATTAASPMSKDDSVFVLTPRRRHLHVGSFSAGSGRPRDVGSNWSTPVVAQERSSAKWPAGSNREAVPAFSPGLSIAASPPIETSPLPPPGQMAAFPPARSQAPDDLQFAASSPNYQAHHQPTQALGGGRTPSFAAEARPQEPILSVQPAALPESSPHVVPDDRQSASSSPNYQAAHQQAQALGGGRRSLWQQAAGLFGKKVGGDAGAELRGLPSPARVRSAGQDASHPAVMAPDEWHRINANNY